MISAQFFKPEVHHPIIAEWWKAQNWPVLSLRHLPELGFVTYAGDVPAAAGFLYQTDSAFCWFEFIVANPAVRGDERDQALEMLIQKAQEAAECMGFGTIFMSVNNQKLIHRLKAKGFQQNESGMTNLAFVIKEKK
jgi:hypothetical protein